jgi:hypothetical protein
MPDRSTGRDDPLVTVYRVVDATEPSYLETHGDYGSNPSQSRKYFALTIEGARAFAGAPMNAGTTITTAALPKSLVDRGAMLNDPDTHGAGVSLFFSQQQLADVYDTTAAPVVWKGVER